VSALNNYLQCTPARLNSK